MDIKITKEEARPLLNRKDVSAVLSYETTTPSRAEIRKEVAGRMKAKEELVVITKIVPENGVNEAKLDFRVYNDENALKNLEHKYQLKRHGFAVEEKKAAAPEAK